MKPLQTFRIAMIACVAFLLSSCGGGGSGSADSSSSSISGHVIDGPIAGARIEVLDANGTLIASTTTADDGSYVLQVGSGHAYPLTVVGSGGVDTVTGQPFREELRSIVTGRDQEVANVSPMSTVIYHAARRLPGGLTRANVNSVARTVVQELGFSLVEGMRDPLAQPLDADTLLSYMMANEVIEKTVRSVGGQVLGADDSGARKRIYRILAEDLLDGRLDGDGSDPEAARAAAQFRVQALQMIRAAVTDQARQRNMRSVAEKVARAPVNDTPDRMVMRYRKAMQQVMEKIQRETNDPVLATTIERLTAAGSVTEIVAAVDDAVLGHVETLVSETMGGAGSPATGGAAPGGAGNASGSGTGNGTGGGSAAAGNGSGTGSSGDPAGAGNGGGSGNAGHSGGPGTPAPIRLSHAMALVELFDTNHAAWALSDLQNAGNRLHTDRPYTWKILPQGLEKAIWLRTANESRNQRQSPLARIQARQALDLYLLFRQDIAPVPQWIQNGWERTGMTASNSEPRTYALWKRSVAPGKQVALGPNGSTRSGMYVLALVPQGTQVVANGGAPGAGGGSGQGSQSGGTGSGSSAGSNAAAAGSGSDTGSGSSSSGQTGGSGSGGASGNTGNGGQSSGAGSGNTGTGQAQSGASGSPGEVAVRFLNLGSVKRQQVPVTFGQVFRQGDLPKGYGLKARFADGTEVPVQVDAKALYADDSVRHAVLSLVIPSLAGGQEVDATLIPLPAGSASRTGAAVPADALRIELNVGGTTYTADLQAELARNAARVEKWLDGELVTEWHVSLPFRNASGGLHPHLRALLDLRKYQAGGNVRLDFTIENTWAFVEGIRDYSYDIRVLASGREVFSRNAVKHYHRARWHKVVWLEDGGASQVMARLDTRYLIAAGAVPSYDLSIRIPDSVLNKLAADLQAADTGPMGNAMLRTDFSLGGADPQIGPLPMWTAMYLLSMDPRAYRAMLANADAGGSYATHYRDSKTLLAVSLDDYPYMTIQGTYNSTINPKTGKSEAFAKAVSSSSPLKPDSAHQPSLAYVPYLVTGDRYYLDELIFWADFNLFKANPKSRGHALGLVKYDQPRGQAWDLRTLAQAAYILPELHPMKGYFLEKLYNNINWYIANYVDNPDANPLGWINDGFAVRHNDSRPWMDDFFTWSVGYVVELGFREALPMLRWKAKFPVGRMTSPDFCWILASSYSLKLGTVNPLTYYSFREVYEAEKVEKGIQGLACGSPQMLDRLGLKAGEMIGHAKSPVGYPANLQPALAVSVESGIPNADLAWQRFQSRSRKPDYSTQPQFAIVPNSYLGGEAAGGNGSTTPAGGGSSGQGSAAGGSGAGTQTVSEAVIEWDVGGSDITSYEIYHGGSATAANVLLASVPVSGTTASYRVRPADLGYASGDTVCFALRAYNSFGGSDLSAPACVTLP